MIIKLGSIGKLGDPETKRKIIELSKDNPKMLENFERYIEIMTDAKVPNVDGLLELSLVEHSGNEITKLIPLKEQQEVNYKIWNEYTPCENKLELWDGEALGGGEERDRMLLMLVYNTGLEHFVKMLPEESIKELRKLL